MGKEISKGNPILGKEISKGNPILGKEPPHLLTFYDYPKEIQYAIYTTNWIERMNKEFKKQLRPMNSIPSLEAAEKIIDLKIIDYTEQWSNRKMKGFDLARERLQELFEHRYKLESSQLDPQGTEEVFQAVHNLSREGMTVLFAEHKMEKVAQYADRILWLDEGKMVALDRPASLFSREDLGDHGIAAPIYTQVCKLLKRKSPDGKTYPVTLEGATEVLKGWN